MAWGEWEDDKEDATVDGKQDAIVGTYKDEWQAGQTYVLERSGAGLTVSDATGSYGSTDVKVEGSKVEIWRWKLYGAFEQGKITWEGGKFGPWVREAAAEKAGAPAAAQPQPASGALAVESNPWEEDAEPEAAAPWPQATPAVNISGTYRDDWQDGALYKIEQQGNKLVVPGDSSWDDGEGTIDGINIEIWGKKATFKDGSIAWEDGNVWQNVQAAPGPSAPSAAARGETGTVEDGEAVDVSGTYEDPWQKNVRTVIKQQGTELTAGAPDGSWGPDRGTINGCKIELFGMTAEFSQGSIRWQNGGVWPRVSGPDEAPGDSGGTGAVAAAADAWGAWGAGADGAAGGAASATWGTADAAAAPVPDVPVSDPGKKSARWTEFSKWQEWYKNNNILPGKSQEEVEEDEKLLFAQISEDRAGLAFDLYDKVTCDISGPKSENIPELTTFEALYKEFEDYLPDTLVENLRRCGFKRPTPVQKFSLPAALTGRDIMCCAQTGTGKTAAFLVPILSSMIKHSKATGALTQPYEGACKPDTVVISPTRELCLQIYDEARKMCHKTPHRCVRIYGQEPVKVQIQELAKGGDLCIATPGRLWDFVDSGIVDVSDVNCLVLDEADRMLMMKMELFIREVVEKYNMPGKEDRQTLMFSATFPDACQKLAQDYLYDHVWIGVGSVGGAVCLVKQTLMKVAQEDKFETLYTLLLEWLENREEHERLLIFCNKKIEAKGLDERLYERNIDTGALHGDLSQTERETNLQRLRSGDIDVLVATDVASRGLDIINVSHVVNYDLPWQAEGYVQRIGRTGRIGHRGLATTFITVDKATDELLDDKEVLKALPTILKDDTAGCDNEVPTWLLDYAEKAREKEWVQKDDKWWSQPKDSRDTSAWQDQGASSNGQWWN